MRTEDGAGTVSPPGILVTGCDASHQPALRRSIAVKLSAIPLQRCRNYATALRGVHMPAEIEISAARADGRQ